MSIRTPPPYPSRAPRVLSVALLANLLGLLLLLAAAVGVLFAAWHTDRDLGLAVTSVLVGFTGWRLTLLTDGD